MYYFILFSSRNRRYKIKSMTANIQIRIAWLGVPEILGQEISEACTPLGSICEHTIVGIYNISETYKFLLEYKPNIIVCAGDYWTKIALAGFNKDHIIPEHTAKCLHGMRFHKKDWLVFPTVSIERLSKQVAQDLRKLKNAINEKHPWIRSTSVYEDTLWRTQNC